MAFVQPPSLFYRKILLIDTLKDLLQGGLGPGGKGESQKPTFYHHESTHSALQYRVQKEVKESFASPDYSFYGKALIVKQLYQRMAAKSPFASLQYYTRGNGPKWNPAQIDAHYLPRSHLSGLIQRIGQYLATTKGCRMRYFKDPIIIVVG